MFRVLCERHLREEGGDEKGGQKRKPEGENGEKKLFEYEKKFLFLIVFASLVVPLICRASLEAFFFLDFLGKKVHRITHKKEKKEVLPLEFLGK